MNSFTDKVGPQDQSFNGPADVRRFRPNIVVGNTTMAFEEDRWLGRTLQIGEHCYDVVKPCARCTMPGVDPESGKRMLRDRVMVYLQEKRSDDEGETYMGMNLGNPRLTPTQPRARGELSEGMGPRLQGKGSEGRGPRECLLVCASDPVLITYVTQPIASPAGPSPSATPSTSKDDSSRSLGALSWHSKLALVCTLVLWREMGHPVPTRPSLRPRPPGLNPQFKCSTREGRVHATEDIFLWLQRGHASAVVAFPETLHALLRGARADGE